MKPGFLGQSLLLGLAIFVVFGLSLWSRFLYDDMVFLIKNIQVTGPWLGWRAWITAGLAHGPGEYEPLLTLIHRVLYSIGGQRPFLYRLTSLLMHWANAVLIMLIYRRLLGPKSAYFWAALLFALYPAHTEVLAISTFKKHLLVSFFGFLMLTIQEQRTLALPWRAMACSTALLLGLMSKDSAFILPPLCLAVSLGSARDWRKRLKEDRFFYAGLLAVCLGFIAWRAAVVPRSIQPLVGESWGLHLLTSGKCLLWYLWQLLTPLQLCQESSLSPVAAILSRQGLLVATGLIETVILVLMIWRRDRICGVAAAWCGLTLAPFLNIVPFLNLSLVANRYLYLASAGFFLGVGRLLDRLGAKARFGRNLPAAAMIAVFAGLFYAALGMNNLALYSDPLDLWSHTIQCAPDHPRGYTGLGAAYYDRGQYEQAASNLERALELFRKYPDTSAYVFMTYLNLTAAYGKIGRLDDAIRISKEQLRVYPNSVAHSNLGIVQLMHGDSKQALPHLEEALRQDPRNGDALMNLGLYYYANGKNSLAEQLWLTARSLPDYRIPTLDLLGALYLRQGRDEKARPIYEELLAQNSFQLEAVGHLARLYKKKGQAERGRALYDRTIAQLERQISSLKGMDTDASLQQAAQENLVYVRRERDNFLTGRVSGRNSGGSGPRTSR